MTVARPRTAPALGRAAYQELRSFRSWHSPRAPAQPWGWWSAPGHPQPGTEYEAPPLDQRRSPGDDGGHLFGARLQIHRPSVDSRWELLGAGETGSLARRSLGRRCWHDRATRPDRLGPKPRPGRPRGGGGG